MMKSNIFKKISSQTANCLRNVNRSLLVFVLLTVLMISICSPNYKSDYRSDLNGLKYRLLGPVSADDHDMLTLLRENYLLPPDPRPYNTSSNDRVYIRNNNLHGGNTKKKIQEVFSHIHGGFFIEAGALDGVYLSTTLWLEQERGWTGLLVEPNIFSYSELLHKHRKAWVSNTCLSRTQYPRETVLVSYRPRRSFYKAMNLKGSSHEYDIDQKDINSESFFNSGTRHLTNVQCFPLISYLLALNISTVDFLSLDLQGSERVVLDTLPWESVNIRTMALEINSKLQNQEFLEDMKKRGYTRVNFTDTDFLFIKNGDHLLDK